MADLHVSITYPVKNPGKLKVKSNIEKSYLLEFLTDVVRAQMGAGKDKSKAKKLNVYHIGICCDLSYDNISIKSDTGNKGLTLGIIMDVLGRLEDMEQVSYRFSSGGTKS